MDNVLKNVYMYTRKYKAFPPIKWLSLATDLPHNKIYDYLSKLIQEKLISKHGNTYYIPDMKKVKDYLTPNEAPAPRVRKKKESPVDKIVKESTNKEALTDLILRGLLLFISAGATFISVYFTLIWFLNFLILFIAVIAALTLVSYGVVSFSAAAYAAKKRNFMKAFFILITGILVIISSMFFTVAGQYKEKSKEISVNIQVTKEAKKDVLKLDLLKQKMFDKKGSITRLTAEVQIAQKLLSEFTKEETAEYAYQVQLWKVGQLNEKIKAYEKELEAITNDIGAHLDSEETQIETVNRSDFFVWVADILHTTAENLEFQMYLIPAIIFDIIAPLALLFGLGLQKREKKIKINNG